MVARVLFAAGLVFASLILFAGTQVYGFFVGYSVPCVPGDLRHVGWPSSYRGSAMWVFNSCRFHYMKLKPGSGEQLQDLEFQGFARSELWDILDPEIIQTCRFKYDSAHNRPAKYGSLYAKLKNQRFLLHSKRIWILPDEGAVLMFRPTLGCA